MNNSRQPHDGEVTAVQRHQATSSKQIQINRSHVIVNSNNNHIESSSSTDDSIHPIVTHGMGYRSIEDH